MRNFDAHGLAMLLRHIETASRHAQTLCDQGARDDTIVDEQAKSLIQPILDLAEKYARDIELDSTLKRVWRGGGPFFFAVATGITYQKLQHELEVLRQAIEADLSDRTFVFIPPVDAKLLIEMKETWSGVWEALPDSLRDTREAISCYALDRNTAAVFHLMRVAEYGLRHIARKLRVKITHTKKAMPIEFADWEKVITGIKNKIDDVRKLPIGPKRQGELEQYSDAADHCVYMKDIWRNNVSHARKPYKKTDALNVLERVRDFMQFVAANFK